MTTSIPRSFRADTGMLYGNNGKELCDEERWIYYAGDILLAFLVTGTNPLHSFRMTISVSYHYDDFRTPSFRALERIPYEKAGRQQYDTKRRICYSDDSLPSSSSSQRILHIRSGWHFTVFLATVADSSLICIMTPSALSVLWLLPFAEERGSLKFKIFSPKLLTRKSSFAKIITIFKSVDGKK